MSQLIIHYDSLKTASEQAKKAGEKLSDYADKAFKKVAKKLDDYTGEKAGNVSSAITNIDAKIKKLNKKSEAFISYAANVDSFLDSARETDQGVESKIKELSGDFKSSYGIKDSVVDKFFNLVSGKLNDSALGRFFKDMAQVVGKVMGNVKDSLVDWYKYEGGKYKIDEILAVGAEILACIAIVAAFSASSIVFVVAGVVVGVFGLANAIYDRHNSKKAYDLARGGDPAWAKRYGDLNTMTDTMREESNDMKTHILASGLDAVEFVAKSVKFVGDVKDIYNTGSEFIGKIKDTPGGLKKYVADQYSTGANGFKNVKNAVFGHGSIRSNAQNTVKLYTQETLHKLGGDLKNIVNGTFSADATSGFSKSFREIFSGNDKVKGASGLINGSDLSVLNFAYSIDNTKALIESMGKYGPAAIFSGGTIGDLVMGSNNAFSDARDLFGSNGEYMDRGENYNVNNILHNISGMKDIHNNSRLRKLLNQNLNPVMAGNGG